jgi:cytochrome c biogenesis protein CcdA
VKKEVSKTASKEPINLQEEFVNIEDVFNLIGFLAGFSPAFLDVLLVFILAFSNKGMKRSAWLVLGVLVLFLLLGVAFD